MLERCANVGVHFLVGDVLRFLVHALEHLEKILPSRGPLPRGRRVDGTVQRHREFIAFRQVDVENALEPLPRGGREIGRLDGSRLLHRDLSGTCGCHTSTILHRKSGNSKVFGERMGPPHTVSGRYPAGGRTVRAASTAGPWFAAR